jgi:hypothetical protein
VATAWDEPEDRLQSPSKKKQTNKPNAELARLHALQIVFQSDVKKRCLDQHKKLVKHLNFVTQENLTRKFRKQTNIQHHSGEAPTKQLLLSFL